MQRIRTNYMYIYINLIARKPVFRVSNQVRLKATYLATEAS